MVNGTPGFWGVTISVFTFTNSFSILFSFLFVIFSSCSFEISVISFIFSSFSRICGCIIN